MSKFCCFKPDLGGTFDPYPRHYRWVDEGTTSVAIPWAHLQFWGYNEADAWGGSSLPDCKQTLEGGHDTLCEGPKGDDIYQIQTIK